MQDANLPDDLERWVPRLRGWAARLRALRLDGAAGVLLDVAEPLGPIGAQLLWVVQPALAWVAPRDEVAALARLIDAPGGVAWMREQLIAGDGEESDHE